MTNLSLRDSRERQVTILLLYGMNLREIADTLGIARGTVRIYARAAYERAGVDNQIRLIHSGAARRGKA